jgi:L-lactate dehydrogenase complex protein LldF
VVDELNFHARVQAAIRDSELRRAVEYGTGLGYKNRRLAVYADGIQHGDAVREQAAAIKRHALRNLPDLLIKAEQTLTENGFKVLWAWDANEANSHVVDISRKHDCNLAVKSKSMLTEEIELNSALFAAGLEVVETDLGEFILQVGRDKPSHIVVPIVHRTKQEIKHTLTQTIGMPATDDTKEMTQYVREYLRKRFLQADLGISGGNFVVAESGSLCLVTNEGNGRMVTSLPPVHVALVGIEKVVETLEEYAALTQLLPRSATGQHMAVYTQIVNGPRRSVEEDGPEHAYIIFVDNGRSKMYNSIYADALACIRCGACLNACPVYRSIGGHAYGWVYPGPIGSVISSLFRGMEMNHQLAYASSLCGECKDVCPVMIDLPRMLLNLRNNAVESRYTHWLWRLIIKGLARISVNPDLFRIAGSLAFLGGANFVFKYLPGPLRGWTKYRTTPKFAQKSFQSLWKARQKRGKNG